MRDEGKRTARAVAIMGTVLCTTLLVALAAHAQTDGRPETPYFTGTNPPSGSNDNHPRFFGVAQADTIVTLHNTPDCSGEHLGEGTAAEFANPGIAVSVRDNSTTTLWVHVNQGTLGGRQSHCSIASMTYVEKTSRRAAIKECKRKFRGKKHAKKRRKCLKRARKYPV